MSGVPTLNSSQIENIEERYLPAEEGLWVFVFGDLILFALFFGLFSYYRAHNVELFIEAQKTLNQTFGFVNTFLLLTSSWFVVLALKAARQSLWTVSSRNIVFALMCGGAFSVIKIIEYSQKIKIGIYLTTNDFFMYYYILTLTHFLHVIIGMGMLFYMLNLVRRAAGTGTTGTNILGGMEGGAIYWHMVDSLWVILFPLIYLMR